MRSVKETRLDALVEAAEIWLRKHAQNIAAVAEVPSPEDRNLARAIIALQQVEFVAHDNTANRHPKHGGFCDYIVCVPEEWSPPGQEAGRALAGAACKSKDWAELIATLLNLHVERGGLLPQSTALLRELERNRR